MPLGPRTAAAAALAQACGLTLLDYDPNGLTEALRQGQRCVVVWPDPDVAIAAALRDQSAPSVAAAKWCSAAQDLLTLFTRNRRKLLLVAASLITRADPADLDRLAARLPLMDLLIPPAAVPDDLPALLARLAAAHLSDMRPLWEELQACSLAPLERSPHSADLDPLVSLLAEANVQRVTVEGLLRDLTEARETVAAAQALHAADAQQVARLDQELAWLRDQLADLTGVLSQDAMAHQATLHEARLTLQAERESVAQSQSRVQSELDLVRDQLHALSDALGAGPDTSAEIGLLRDQLVAVTALLHDAGQPALGPAHIQIEAAFATLLTALATETDLRRKAQPDALPVGKPDVIPSARPMGRTMGKPAGNKPGLRHPVPARPGS